jgi:tRNA pseudouridine synthase 9
MQSPYVFENGLRHVLPYFLQSKIHPKQRWVGKTLFEVFHSEFKEAPSIIQHEIENKLLYIQTNHGRKKNTQEILQGWDVLRNRPIDSFDVISINKHKHEPSVPLQAKVRLSTFPSQSKTTIRIIYEDSDLLVILKPSGIPTHPTGNYHYNTITEILKFDLQMNNIWPCHRLDKVTSGVLILAKNKHACYKYQKCLQEDKLISRKSYYARVCGKFPEEEVMINCPIFSINSCGGFLVPSNANEIPINSTTVFKLIQYDAKTNQSVVVCKPITGRMHQIRIHLRNAGFPIVDDHKYNPTNEVLPNCSIMTANNDLEKLLYQRLFDKYPNFEKFLKVDLSLAQTLDTVDIIQITKWDQDQIIKSKVEKIKSKRLTYFETLRKNFNTTCDTCHRDLLDSNKDLTDQSIMLHSFEYECSGSIQFKFTDTAPDWCNI